MASKKSFVLRVQPEVYDAIEKWSADEFRSVNGQIEYLLHQALQASGRMKRNQKERKQDDNAAT